MKTAILYNDGQNNYQSNGFGYDMPSTVKNFYDEMEKRGAEWAHLFREDTGEYITSYFKVRRMSYDYGVDPNRWVRNIDR